VRVFSDFTGEISVRQTVFRLCSGEVCCLHLHGVISHKAVCYRQPKNCIPTPAEHVDVFETRYGDTQTAPNFWGVAEIFRSLSHGGGESKWLVSRSSRSNSLERRPVDTVWGWAEGLVEGEILSLVGTWTRVATLLHCYRRHRAAVL